MPPRLLALTESLQLFWKCVPQNFHLSLPSYSIWAWQSLCFPSSWKVASIVPVFKGVGERSESTNYRPISLLPIISKIFECFVNQQLLEYLEDNDLTDCQYGFRHSRTTDHLNGALDRGGETRVVALDISKAFDKVWHTSLLHKLHSYGVSYGVSDIYPSLFGPGGGGWCIGWSRPQNLTYGKNNNWIICASKGGNLVCWNMYCLFLCLVGCHLYDSRGILIVFWLVVCQWSFSFLPKVQYHPPPPTHTHKLALGYLNSHPPPPPTHTHKLVNTGKRGPPIVPLLFIL